MKVDGKLHAPAALPPGNREFYWLINYKPFGNKLVLVGKPEGKGPCIRPRRRWEDNIRTDLREIGWKVVNWIHLAWGRDQW
jgi:hypothetical protein